MVDEKMNYTESVTSSEGQTSTNLFQEVVNDDKEESGKSSSGASEFSGDEELVEETSVEVERDGKKVEEVTTRKYKEDPEQSEAMKLATKVLRALSKASGGLIPLGHAGLVLVSEETEDKELPEDDNKPDQKNQKSLGDNEKELSGDELDINEIKAALKSVVDDNDLGKLDPVATKIMHEKTDFKSLKQDDVQGLIDELRTTQELGVSDDKEGVDPTSLPNKGSDSKEVVR